jgi:hypothetical protein
MTLQHPGARRWYDVVSRRPLQTSTGWCVFKSMRIVATCDFVLPPFGVCARIALPVCKALLPVARQRADLTGLGHAAQSVVITIHVAGRVHHLRALPLPGMTPEPSLKPESSTSLPAMRARTNRPVVLPSPRTVTVETANRGRAGRCNTGREAAINMLTSLDDDRWILLEVMRRIHFRRGVEDAYVSARRRWRRQQSRRRWRRQRSPSSSLSSSSHRPADQQLRAHTRG